MLAPGEVVSLELPSDTINNLLNLSSLREDARDELLDILESTRGRKALIIDPSLSGLIEKMLLPQDAQIFLKENGSEK